MPASAPPRTRSCGCSRRRRTPDRFRPTGCSEREFHRSLDPLYEIADEQQRQRAFEEVFQQFFTKFELDRVVADLIAERPLIGKHIGRCVVREAPQRELESAELFVAEPDANVPAGAKLSGTERAKRAIGTLVIRLCPGSMLEPARIRPLIRRELLHVSDMFDECFAFKREALAGIGARQSLQRDRYRVLWDIYVEARLEREGRSENGAIERLQGGFQRVFRKMDAGVLSGAFGRVFGASSLTHGDLWDWACTPDGLLGPSATPAHAVPQTDGEPCPLCGFATYDWFEFGRDETAAATEFIRKDFPDWSRQEGACRQCVELYASRSALRA